MHILELQSHDQDEEIGSNGVSPADSIFRTVPKDSTAFIVWKITEQNTELVSRCHYGIFYDSECYLIYSASLPGHLAGPDVIRREVRETGANACPAERHIHIWVGNRASSTLAALSTRRATQLNGHLTNRAVLHREAPAHESPRLVSYFATGIKIIKKSEDGVNTNFRLFRVKGRRPLLVQMSSVNWAHLCGDGVFLIDTPNVVFLWLGRAANLVEKIFGAKIAYRMARGGDKSIRARRIAIAHDGYEQTLELSERNLLDALLPLRDRSVRPFEARPALVMQPAKLYRLYPNRSTCRVEEIKCAPLVREDLCEDGVYVVEAGARGVWAWRGSRAGLNAGMALRQARALTRRRRTDVTTCPVAAVHSGREPVEFCALFRGWKYCDARRDGQVRVARSATTRLDAPSLAAAAWLAAQTQLLDDGSGALRMWRVFKRRGLTELQHPQCGVFFDQDCYIVLYTYHAPTGDQSVIYYWMGGSSPNDLRSLGAKEARDMYVKLNRLPMQVRVYQGKETAHFLQVFKGRMTTYTGSAIDNDPHGRRVIPPQNSLVRVSGQYAREARGVEVRKGTVSQANGSCYVLRQNGRVWVWCGARTTGDEREQAKQIAASEHTLVMQGMEPDDFWTALGDKKSLLVTKPLNEVDKPLPARLFYISLGVPGQFSFDEIIQFNQYDLLPEMVAILDAHCNVFIWLGDYCGQYAKEHAFHMSEKYLETDPSSRDPETAITVIHQGKEPPSFTGFFPHWKASLWKGHKSFNAIVHALEGKAIIQNCGGKTVKNGHRDTEEPFDQFEKYPIHVLRGPLDKIPQNVDPLYKELYLTHDDFVATFGMPYSEFKQLPNWKQKDFKKIVGLF